MKFPTILALSLILPAYGLGQQISPGVTLAPKASAPPGSDVIVLADDEKLIGTLESANSKSVVFKSNIVGEVTIEWAKIREIHSSQTFAAIPKGTTGLRQENAPGVARGTIALTDHQLEITGASAPAQKIRIDNLQNVVPEAAYEKAYQRTSLLHGWKGGFTGGVSLVEATQKNTTFNGAINLVRTVPAENWLDVRSRTIFDYTETYGKLSQPATPTVKTSLYQLGLEQDFYFSSRVFVFGQGLLDHNFSQGLYLQQTYGGGLGFVVFKAEHQELDFKASADYIDQHFYDAALDQSLFGSVFGETYLRTFATKIVLNEQAGITPAWNDTNAYSAFASMGLTFPVYRHLGLTLGSVDNFLNDPPPGFKKNSFQFTAGVTYSVK